MIVESEVEGVKVEVLLKLRVRKLYLLHIVLFGKTLLIFFRKKECI